MNMLSMILEAALGRGLGWVGRGRWMRRLLGLWIGLLMGPLALQAALAQGVAVKAGIDLTASDRVNLEQVSARLVVHAPQGVQAGGTLWLGLWLRHSPDWHTYWQNPGDSGLPTRLNWTLPEGWQAGAIAWPLPRKFPIGDLANFGYDGDVLLAVPVQLPAQLSRPASGTYDIGLQADWLVCRQECIPQEAALRTRVPADSSVATQAALFEAARRQVPAQAPATVQAQAKVQGEGQAVTLEVRGLPADWRGKALTLLPLTPGVLRHAAAQGRDWQGRWQGEVWQASWPVSAERMEGPTQLQWVLAQGQERAPRMPALQLRSPVEGRWPAVASAAVSPALQQALDAAAAQAQAQASPSSAWWLALLGALVGGMILNLMPCVFPVLAIKVLEFSQTGHGVSHRTRGLAYTAGVVLSFVALGALMLGLRAAGEQLGWGFQLQSPWAVSALALLFTLLGLNLAGLFEFGQFMPSGLAGLQSRRPLLDAAWSGVIAVAVASPCTAPFMGASLGLAVTLPAWQALPIFAAMGLGMALPYLAVSAWPRLAERLPRPGAWMQTLRQGLAFPMLATVIWLLWVLGVQVGMDGVAAVLALLLLLAAWLWTRRLGPWGRHGLGGVLALLGLWGLLQALPPRLEVGPAPAAVAATPEAAPARWAAWSPAQVSQQLAAGRTVFVDFTAAWCITCQYNKKTVLADPQLLAAWDQAGVVSLRADWTRRDDSITQALQMLGRSGVPVYAYYRPGQSPLVLSELPSREELLQALRQDTGR